MNSSRRTKVGLVWTFVLALALGAIHRPLLSVARDWRAERLVTEAREHAAEGNWEEVRRAATASLQLRSSLEALRLLFSACAADQTAESLQIAVTLFAHPEANTADRVNTLRLHLDFNDIVGASHLVSALHAPEREDPVMRFQIVRFLLGAHNHSAAIAVVDSLAEEERTPALEILLAEGLSRGGNSEDQAAANSRILRILEGTDRAAALSAISLLASLPDDRMEASLAEKALERFGEDSSLTVTDRLHLDLFRIVLKKADREAVINSAISAHRKEHLEEVVGWLQRLGASEHILELTNPRVQPNGLSSFLFGSRVQALEVLERFDQLEIELNDPPAGAKEIPLLCARAAIAKKHGKESDAVLLWQKAMDRAKRDRSRNWYYFISEVATRIQDHDLAMEALACGVEFPLGAPPPAQELPQLFEWLYQGNDTERLLNISYRLLQREPGNPVLVNNYHYLKVQFGEATEQDVEALKRLVAAFPAQPGFVSSLAFALLKRDNPQEALAVLDALEGSPRPRSEKAIRAAALKSLGHPEDAAAVAAEIDWSEMTADEVRVLKNLVAP